MKKELWIGGAFLALVIAFVLGANLIAADRDQVQAENAVLKQQIARYQAAVWPAVQARGWAAGPIRDVTEVTPDIAKYALNPCFLTPAGDFDENPPYCVRDSLSLEPAKAPEIEILIKRIESGEAIR